VNALGSTIILLELLLLKAIFISRHDKILLRVKVFRVGRKCHDDAAEVLGLLDPIVEQEDIL
jgi:hypothetical protein